MMHELDTTNSCVFFFRKVGSNVRKGYVGTYSGSGSKGIYQFLIDEIQGTISQPSVFAEVRNSKYISLTDTHLYSVYDDENESGVAVFSLDGNCVDKVTYEKITSCFLLVDGEYIYTSNYHLGTVTKLKLGTKLEVVASYFIQEKAGCHQVILHDDKLYVPCLYLDVIYVFDKNLHKISEIMFPKGSGCRHGVVSKDGNYLYVIGELSNKLYVVDLKDYTIVNESSVLPNGEENQEGSAAIRLSMDGTRLYVSTRDKNIVTILEVNGKEVKVLSIFSTEGDHPRDILNVENDTYLLVSNRLSNELSLFDLNSNNKLVQKISIPEGVSIVVEGEA